MCKGQFRLAVGERKRYTQASATCPEHWTVHIGGIIMRGSPRRAFLLKCSLAASLLILPHLVCAQEPAGPQTSPPPPQVPAQPVAQPRPATSEKIRIPAGTRLAVVLENGISTRGAKAGDSVYFHTSFPITQ